MFRLTIRLIVVLLTFAIGVASNMLWVSHHRNHSKTSSVLRESRIFRMTNWQSARGWWKHIYESNDGALVIVERWDRAGSYVEARLYDAVQILDRRPVLDGEGKVVGERVVAILNGRVSAYPRNLILWTDNNVLHTIHATSLADAELFEKDNLK